MCGALWKSVGEKPQGTGSEALRQFLVQTTPPRRTVLILGGVHLLPQDAFSCLLDVLQEARDKGLFGKHISALLAGTDDFLESIWSENSPYHFAARKRVIGFDRERFDQYVARHAVHQSTAEEFRAALYEVTDGHPGLLRGILQFLDDLPENGSPRYETRQDLERVLGEFIIDRGRILPEIQNMFSELQSSNELFSAFIEATRSDKPKLPADPILRERLYLLGLWERSRGQVRVPLYERVLTHYLPDRAIADIFSAQQQWKKAYEFFERQRSARKLPNIPRDPLIRRSVERRIEQQLRELENSTASNVTGFFAKTVEMALDFDVVTSWRWGISADVGGSRWEESGERSGTYGRQIEKQLPLPDEVARAETPVFRRDDDALGAGVLVPSPTPEDTPLFFHLHRLKTETRIDTEQSRRLERICGTFAGAYRVARQSEYARDRARRRRKESQILDALSHLLVEKPNTMELVRLAAKRMVSDLGYRRIVIGLVDEIRCEVKDVVSATAENVSPLDGRRIEGMRRWALDEIDDIQPAVVRTGQAMVLFDAQHTVLADREITETFDIRGLAVIPMISEGRVVGTLHVERTDQRAPTAEEAKELQEFADHLARMVLQCRWHHLLLDSLVSSEDPILLVSPTGNILFANSGFAPLVDVEANKWYGEDGPVCPDKDTTGDCCFVHEALRTEQSIRRFDKRGDTEVTVDCVRDWEGRVIGAVERRLSHAGLLHLNHAAAKLTLAFDDRDAGEIVVRTAVEMGFPFARFYRIYEPQGKPRTLRSFVQFGMDDEGKAAAFDDGRIDAPEPPDRPSNQDYRWLCIHRNQKLVFEHAPDKCGVHLYVVDESRPAIPEVTVREMPHANDLDKKAGDVWIDVPVSVRGELFGKVTVGLPKAWSTMACDALGLLAEHGAAAIARIGQRERERRFLHLASHDLRSPLMAVAELAKIAIASPSESILQTMAEEAQEVVENATELLSYLDAGVSAPSERQRVDMVGFVALIDRLYARRMQQEGRQWTAKTEPKTENATVLANPFDLHLVVTNALDNSLRITSNGDKIGIEVSADDTCVRMKISDTGEGMQEETRERMNDIISGAVREDRHERQHMGVQSMRQFCESHGAEISFRHGSPRGTILEITLRRIARV